MTEKIFRSILSVSMTALLLCVILVIGILYSHFNNQLAEEMYNELTFISSGIEISGEAVGEGEIFRSLRFHRRRSGSFIHHSESVSTTRMHRP